MGYHQGDNLDGSYGSGYYPSGRTSSAGRSSLPGVASGFGLQALGNVFQFDASGSQYHNGSQNPGLKNPFFPHGAKDNPMDSQPGSDSAQGYTHDHFFFSGSTQDAQVPGSSSSLSGISEDLVSYHSTPVPEPKPFGKAAGTQDNSYPWLLDASPLAIDDGMVSSAFLCQFRRASLLKKRELHVFPSFFPSFFPIFSRTKTAQSPGTPQRHGPRYGNVSAWLDRYSWTSVGFHHWSPPCCWPHGITGHRHACCGPCSLFCATESQRARRVAFQNLGKSMFSMIPHLECHG